MRLPKDDAAVLSARWTEGVLLKRDVFSTVERGRFRSPDGEVEAVLRRLDWVPWWSYLPARHLFARERRALARARGLHVGPELLWAGRQALVRGFIDGVALHLAKPFGDAAYFRSAKQALRKLHRAGICHNDLAKEQNWLRGGVGLYAFVEADRTALEAQLRSDLAAANGPKPPEHIQVVQALPRDAAGKLRTEILQLVAMNQLDLIEPLMTSETDRAFVKSILESRKNLRDRFNFEVPP